MDVNADDVNHAFDAYVNALGEFLEHKGFSDDEIDAYFLEHYGVKGMRWGTRSTRQKLAITGSAAAAYVAGSSVVLGMTLNPIASIAAGSASAVAGARVAARIIDNMGDTPVSDLRD